MEKKYKHNSVEMTGNVSSIGEIKTKSNGNEFMYINIAQNSKDGKASFYPVYLDGVMLEKFKNDGYKVGDRITAVGKLESYQKDSKQTLQIRPFEVEKVEYENTKDNSQTVKNESTKEVGM